MTHNVVEQRIDAGGQKVEHTRCVVQYAEVIIEWLRTATDIYQRYAIDSHQALGVKGCPAEEEGNGYSYCKEGGKEQNKSYSMIEKIS